LTAHFAAQGTATPVVEVTGWNVPTQSAQIGVDGRANASQKTNH
jgi:exo-1,4-beta-D-glucosaminidase